MKKLLSFEEIYAELHGSDYKADLRDQVEEILAVSVPHNDVVIAKVLEIDPITPEWIDAHFDEACQYVSVRVDNMQKMLEVCCETDSDYRTINSALAMIEVSLQELAPFNRFLNYLLSYSQLAIIYRAQHILPHD